ncbi:unnamed protein product, partial [marine sediment metagenome]
TSNMSADDEPRGWLRLAEPPTGRLSSKQEDMIRAYAFEEGYDTLRGFHMHLRSLGWDYYDILKEAYR